MSSREPPTEVEYIPVSPLGRTTETDNERELHQDDTNADVTTAGMFVREQNIQAQDGSPRLEPRRIRITPSFRSLQATK